ncbi:hypothetical protein BZJ19_05780 [Salinivibrio proteolyticus]|uniref:Uncharacterized protein n=1 Tax=Salinivibrio proteolyticus TaxID=334715 RepID=A0ABY7LCZ5_9GAMM|nr:hypothetical protein [Salinivibrio proteolyticus]OOF26045.1 hypothetical protein BZJ19_05780 [Salinivibrio proteolyticus]WBA15122.1 hypothetical protein N7E60_02070 [Salinivibrio proteolyticus]
MQNRRFYRLDEIHDVTPITKGDLLAAVEEGLLSLCAWVDEKSMGAMLAAEEGHRPTLANLFAYKGVLGLTQDQSIACIHSKTAPIRHALILEPDRVSHWREVKNDFPDAENGPFTRVSSLPQRPMAPFMAYGAIGTKATYGQEARQLAQAGPEEWSRQGFSGLWDALAKTGRALEAKPLAIDADQLRFDLQAVNTALDLRPEGETGRSISAPDTGNIETHPIKIMIRKVLAGDRDAKALKVWHAIKRDHQNDAHQIDEDGLITGINHDEIEWFGRGDHINRITYKTFKNYVSDIRKSL